MRTIFFSNLAGQAAGAALIALAAIQTCAVTEAAEAVPTAAVAPASDRELQDREADRRNLRRIYDAIQAFKQKRGDLPAALSDLFPEFLQDTNVLISPEHARSGRFPSTSYKDPKHPASYSYQFSSAPSDQVLEDGSRPTMKQWKPLNICLARKASFRRLRAPTP